MKQVHSISCSNETHENKFLELDVEQILSAKEQISLLLRENKFYRSVQIRIYGCTKL